VLLLDSVEAVDGVLKSLWVLGEDSVDAVDMSLTELPLEVDPVVSVLAVDAVLMSDWLLLLVLTSLTLEAVVAVLAVL